MLLSLGTKHQVLIPAERCEEGAKEEANGVVEEGMMQVVEENLVVMARWLRVRELQPLEKWPQQLEMWRQ